MEQTEQKPMEQCKQKQHYVTVLKKDGTPASPTIRGGRVRKLLDSGKAKVVRSRPFTIQLLYDIDGQEEETLGVDPGRTNIGLASVKDDGTCTMRLHVETRNKEIPKLMTSRATHRRKHRDCGRRDVRQRRAKRCGTVVDSPDGTIRRLLPGCEEPIVCNLIRNKEARFNNRLRDGGWLTPTARQLLDTHLAMIEQAVRMRPVKKIVVELNRFAFMALDDPDIKKHEFQKGALYGYEGLHDAVNEQQGGVCLLCGTRAIEHYHHIVPRNKRGSDTLPNIAGLCASCHDKVHKDAKKDAKLRSKKAGLNKEYGALSVLNQIIPSLLKELAIRYPDKEIVVTTGYDTAHFRTEQGIEKSHSTDAYCIACAGLGNTCPDTDNAESVVEQQVMQFRRHDRQVCHKEMLDRKYYSNGKVVCRNRHKATEQKTDSLEEYRASEGECAVIRLKVPEHLPQYKNRKRAMPGSVISWTEKLSNNDIQRKRKPKTALFVMKGSDGSYNGHPNYYVSTDGKRYPFLQCEVVRQNAGLVYL